MTKLHRRDAARKRRAKPGDSLNTPIESDAEKRGPPDHQALLRGVRIERAQRFTLADLVRK